MYVVDGWMILKKKKSVKLPLETFFQIAIKILVTFCIVYSFWNPVLYYYQKQLYNKINSLDFTGNFTGAIMYCCHTTVNITNSMGFFALIRYCGILLKAVVCGGQ